MHNSQNNSSLPDWMILKQSKADVTLHASAVRLGEQALVVVGQSGTGKSSLCLQLMAFGASLVSDDITHVSLHKTQLWVRPAGKTPPRIEARGIGVLETSTPARSATLKAIIRLDIAETQRLPERKSAQILGACVPEIHRIDAPHFAAALLQLLKSRPIDPERGPCQ